MAKEPELTSLHKSEISETYRQLMISKIEQALEKSGKNWPSSSSEIENTLFVKSKNAAEYANNILQLVKYLNDSAPKDEE